ncbi:MAG: UvrB/UvrC motif-containing protein [Spirochaetaceae bacterium]|nr:UvrB/UvrC motif-containing protein [Spirochaetaceae bacterium]MBR3814196.1 UvrB/UvrC motif-containing protein [Spirochaetaceae bacterium]MDD6488166.1 UvrB/UvrC motif-containing protein [Spirochaetales bacterium]
MKCDICGIRNAVLFVQQVSATRTVELHLCVECAKERGINVAGKNVEVAFNNLLSGLLQNSELANQISQPSSACPVCGKTLADLRRTKTAGCPECYTVFKSEIFSILKSHGIEGTYHGGLPKKLAHFRSVLTDRMMYQEKLAEAVAVEDYEKAAVYRDRLKALETRSAQPYDPEGDFDE